MSSYKYYNTIYWHFIFILKYKFGCRIMYKPKFDLCYCRKHTAEAQSCQLYFRVFWFSVLRRPETWRRFCREGIGGYFSDTLDTPSIFFSYFLLNYLRWMWITVSRNPSRQPSPCCFGKFRLH